MLLVMLPILIPAVKRQLKKPEFDDEYMFDDFVCNDLFPEDKFEIVDPVKTVPEFGNDKFQGFIIRRISDNLEFYIITKYADNSKVNEIRWCDNDQLSHYKFLSDVPAYIVIGIGGSSHFPDKLYLMPFKQFSSNKIRLTEILPFEIKYGQEINFTF